MNFYTEHHILLRCVFILNILYYSSWLGFASLMKIKLTKSTFPAGTLVTYQAYAGSTSSIAVTAGKGLVGVWCYGCTVFPPLTFSSMADLREDSKEEAALLTVRRHVPRSSARVVHSRWLMLHAPRDFLECLYSASLVPLCFGGQKKVRHIK